MMYDIERLPKPGDEVWIVAHHSSGCKNHWKPKLVKVTELSWKLNRSGKDMGPAFIADGTRRRLEGLNKNWFYTLKDCEEYIINAKK